jgi:lipid-A-disaccharide synthase
MVAIARRFPEMQFVVTGVSWVDSSIYAGHVAGVDNVKVVVDRTQ